MMEPHDCNFRHASCINDRCPLHRAMRCLARCLRDGAALAWSFQLGWRAGYDACPCGDSVRDLFPDHWRPGCRRNAPGYGGES